MAQNQIILIKKYHIFVTCEGKHQNENTLSRSVNKSCYHIEPKLCCCVHVPLIQTP